MLPKLLKFIAYMSSGGHPVLGFPACMLALDLPKRKHKSGRIATCAIRGQPLLLASQEPWAVALAPGIPRYIIHKLVCIPSTYRPQGSPTPGTRALRPPVALPASTVARPGTGAPQRATRPVVIWIRRMIHDDHQTHTTSPTMGLRAHARAENTPPTQSQLSS